MARARFFPMMFLPEIPEIKAEPVPEKKSQIIDCNDINILREGLGLDAWLLMDLDNTAFEPGGIYLASTVIELEHHELGSDQWFYRFIEFASKAPLTENDPTPIALVLTIYRAVQQFIYLKLVQPEVADIIKLYQAANKSVLAITARDPSIMDITLQQLERLNINFSGNWGKEIKLDVGDKTDHAPTLKNGVLFCGDHSKATCLKALLKYFNKQPNILMVDDKDKHLKAVIEMVEKEYQGTVIALHYRRLDEKVKNHNFVAAQEKLRGIRDKLSVDAQVAMTKLGI